MTVISNSKEIWAPSGSTPWTLYTQFEVTSQSVANNTSTISLSGYLKSGGGSFSGSTSNALVLVWHDNNGNADKQIAVLNVASASAGQQFNVSGTYTATHKSDGTLSGYTRTVWLKRNSNNYTPDEDYVNTANTALTTIPRQSVPTVSDSRPTLGTSFTVYTNRNSSSFTHTIQIIAGSTVLKEVTNVGASVSINSSEFATTLLDSDTTATQYPLEIRCTTNGVGSGYKACSVVMVTTETAHGPSLSNFAVTETSGYSFIPSNTTVTNMSHKHISINVDANHADIRSAVLTNGSQNINLTNTSGTLYEADLVPTSGTYSVKVVSSRGSYSATETKTETEIAYTRPYFSEVSFERTTDTGSTGTLTVAGGYWTGTIGSTTNSLSAQYYSINNGSNVNLGVTSNPFTKEYSISNVLYDQDYRIEVHLMDAFGQEAVYTDFLRSAKPLFWMGRETARCAKHWIFDGDGTNGSIELFPSTNGGIKWGNTTITKAIFDTLPSGGGGSGEGGITVETDPTVPDWAKAATKPTYTASEVGAIPAPSGGSTGQVLKKTANGVEWAAESDPTVPSWAKASTKPTYTASEVGALPSNTFIPELTSDLTNDSNFVSDANYQHTSVSGDGTNIVITHGNNTFQTFEAQYLDIELDLKLDAPTTSGSTGQVLTKTASGVAWETPSSITVDSSMSSTSTNPVQNKVIKAAIDALSNVFASAEPALGTTHVYISSHDGDWEVPTMDTIDALDLPLYGTLSIGAMTVTGEEANIDLTYSEISTAVAAGRDVVLVNTSSSTKETLRFMRTDSSLGHIFMGMRGDRQVSIANKPSSGNGEYTYYTIPSTASDVGAIANPSSGSTGQFLQKTASGVQWATVSGGGSAESDITYGTFTVSGSGAPYNVTSSLSYSDISTALSNDKLVILKGTVDSMDLELPYVGTYSGAHWFAAIAGGMVSGTVVSMKVAQNTMVMNTLVTAPIPAGDTIAYLNYDSSEDVLNLTDDAGDEYSVALLSDIPTVSSTITSGGTDAVNSTAVIAYINSLDATNTEY